MAEPMTVSIQGFDAFLKDVQRADMNVQPLVTAALANATGRIQSVARQKARHRTGTLQRSILTQVNYPVGQVSVGEKYGIYVEEGTGIYGPNKTPIVPKTAKVLAFKSGGKMVFARKVKGMAARPFFAPAVEGSSEYVDDQFTKVMERILDAMAGGK